MRGSDGDGHFFLFQRLLTLSSLRRLANQRLVQRYVSVGIVMLFLSHTGAKIRLPIMGRQKNLRRRKGGMRKKFLHFDTNKKKNTI